MVSTAFSMLSIKMLRMPENPSYPLCTEQTGIKPHSIDSRMVVGFASAVPTVIKKSNSLMKLCAPHLKNLIFLIR